MEAVSEKKPIVSEAVTAQMLQIFGDQGGRYKPTEAQVDKILALNEKGMDYTHKERTSFSPTQKIEVGVFVSVVIALVAILWIVVSKAPDYLGETITGIIGFLTCGFGGYSFAKTRNSRGD